MATDSVNIGEDAEMAECDGDKVVTMMDVLQEQQDFEEDANAVLGASDDKNCTYPKGYIKRQALYACLTCCAEARADPTKRAGVCLACSLTCHENHELIELYTKRNFRCDCGNPKFNSHPCQFTPDKSDMNEENIYNQNFSGLYCTCHRPYPDPESTFEDEMIQCIICEDWLHAAHLEAVVPPNDQYSEMICKGCMEKNEFLHDYSLFTVNVEAGDVDVITVNGGSKSADNSLCNGDLENGRQVNGIDESKNDIDGGSVTVNGDVMNDNEKSKEKLEGDSESDKIDKSITPEASEDMKPNVESTETKSQEYEKTDNFDDSKMDLDTESKKVDEEKSIETSEKTTSDDTSGDTEDSTIEKDNADISKNTEAQSEDKPNDTSTDDQIVPTEEKNYTTDDKMDSTDTELETVDKALKEQAETQEQNIEQSTKVESGGGDKVDENSTDNGEKTEQQLIDDLSTLTADQTSEKKKELATEETPAESVEQSEDSKTNDGVKESTNEGGDSSEKKADSEAETTTGIEVPDTSQSEQNEKETANEKSDSVMDAIDELLQTANEAKESDTAEENKESTSESTESTENLEITASDKVDNDVSEKTDEITEINSEDVEMSDTTTQNQSSTSESKDARETEPSDSKKTEVSVNENVENKSSKDIDEKSEVAATASEKENETESAPPKTKETDENDSTNKNELPYVPDNVKEQKRKLSTDVTEVTTSKKAKLECIRPKGVKRVHKGATFWPSNFRQKLCTCGECISMYKDLKVLFLTDIEDTVFAYESLGKENVAGGASQYEKGLQALSSLDRIQQINALTEYNKMRDKLLDFLKSFKDRKEIVKEEDIKAFFAGMKPRREPDGVYFCR